MENRFGLRDFVLLAMLAVVVIVQLLAMKQYDRQWQVMQNMQATLEAQQKQLREFGDLLKRGISVNTATPTHPAIDTSQPLDENDPFYRIKRPMREPNYAQGGWVIQSFASALGKLTPIIDTDYNQSVIESFVVESLAERDPETMEFKPLIAKSWTITDNTQAYNAYMTKARAKFAALADKDASVYQSQLDELVKEDAEPTDEQIAEARQAWINQRIADDPDRPTAISIHFILRDDVVFSDGSPLTAADVVWTFNWMMNPKIAAPAIQSYFTIVRRVTRQGDYQVTFEFSEPYFKGFEMCAGMGILPRHFYRDFTEEQFNTMPGLLMGSGPYRIEDPIHWSPGGKAIELLRNEQYWGPRPTFDRIVFDIITDDNARLVTFTNQDLDLFAPQPDQYVTLKDDPTIDRIANTYKYETVSGGYRYLGWNQQRDGKPTRFADVRVRRAMTMLINRRQMCDKLMEGLADIATGPFHRLSPQADPTVEPWPYDPKRAVALLREAGYEDRDGDGVIEDAAGEPFAFKLVYPAGSTNYESMVLYIKDALTRAGIVCEPDPLEWTILLQRIDNREFDAITLGWSGTVESDPNQIFHSDQIKRGGHNYIHYKNPELDHLIETARVTTDKTKRNEMWHEVHRILHEDQPYTFLFTRKAVAMVNKRVRNVQVTPLGLNSAVEWYIPEALQKWTR